MLKSMTGFGRSVVYGNGYTITVEMKSVNHRYKEIVFRMSKDLLSYEERLKKLINEQIKRGRIDVFVTLEKDASVEESIEINKALLKGYFQAIDNIHSEYPSINGTISIQELLLIPNIITVNKDNLNIDLLSEPLEKAISEALEELTSFRDNEGEQLAIDCINRLELVNKYCDSIQKLTPQLTIDYRNKLTRRLAELLPADLAVDDNRLTTEIALYADKANIDEELTRLYSHIRQFRTILNENESVGRKLDFLMQELNREVNTIGSKSGSVEISNYVVELKSELEKIREQVQNIE
jgi:uncharacterized protein (TIGR00255 family)